MTDGAQKWRVGGELSLCEIQTEHRNRTTRTLIRRAKALGVRRIIGQSSALLYAPGGEPVKDEQAPPLLDAPRPLNEVIARVLDMERELMNSPDLEGIVLRYGFFYGAGTRYASDGEIARAVRRRRYPVVGSGAGIFSFTHVSDAASITVAAPERGRPGIYNAVDSEPTPVRDWLPFSAELLGAPPPRHLPARVARLLAGSAPVYLATQLRGASNGKARELLEWTPRFPSWRDGFRSGPD